MFWETVAISWEWVLVTHHALSQGHYLFRYFSKIKQITPWHPKWFFLPCICVMTVPKARLSTRELCFAKPTGLCTADRCIPRWSHACLHQVQCIYCVIFFSFALGLLSDCKDHNPIPENTSSFQPHLTHNLPYLHHLEDVFL